MYGRVLEPSCGWRTAALPLVVRAQLHHGAYRRDWKEVVHRQSRSNPRRARMNRSLDRRMSDTQRRRLLHQQILSGVAIIGEIEARGMPRVPLKDSEATTPMLTQVLCFPSLRDEIARGFQFDSINRRFCHAVVLILAAAKAAGGATTHR